MIVVSKLELIKFLINSISLNLATVSPDCLDTKKLRGRDVKCLKNLETIVTSIIEVI